MPDTKIPAFLLQLFIKKVKSNHSATSTLLLIASVPTFLLINFPSVSVCVCVTSHGLDEVQIVSLDPLFIIPLQRCYVTFMARVQ